MKHPQTKFHADIMCDSKFIRSNKWENLLLGQNLLLRLTFLAVELFFSYQYLLNI